MWSAIKGVLIFYEIFNFNNAQVWLSWKYYLNRISAQRETLPNKYPIASAVHQVLNFPKTLSPLRVHNSRNFPHIRDKLPAEKHCYQPTYDF